MTHATHTPGPWIAGDDGGIWAAHEDGDPFEVASAYLFADVRLIAEAPAMLAALREAVAATDMEADTVQHNAAMRLETAIEAMRAILARITHGY